MLLKNSLLHFFFLLPEIEIIGYAKMVVLKIEYYNEMQTSALSCSNLLQFMQHKVKVLCRFCWNRMGYTHLSSSYKIEASLQFQFYHFENKNLHV